MEKDLIVEEKIKRSASEVFQQKGFGGARIKDIAEHAGVNNAMVHYYFRSKENLFEEIMEESTFKLFDTVKLIVNDPETNLSEKIDRIVNYYFTILSENNDLPLFVMSEVQSNPDKYASYYAASLNGILGDSIFFKQVEEQIRDKNLEEKISPYQFFVNTVSLCIFPFLGTSILSKIIDPGEPFEFGLLMEERRKLTPAWIKEMLKLEG